MKFRLPRKTKKKLEGKLWLYPADKDGNRLMAFPKRNEEDYIALKKGIVKDSFSRINKLERKIFHEKLDRENYVSDTILKEYVDDIFREGYRGRSYEILIQAKKKPKAVKAYFNFLNAYQLSMEGESLENICCLAVDNAKELIKK
ncbi:hypothetical protein [Wenyingzhuangia sp. 2_MG-2023]|uniref:hypothetical protein n=1 Tax=Wenyingzhuangia sp. 2_MG-2023 TaxID=3062639 RepID=UPI0026E361C5|nr:hypothetical protein [Wenyingzhuangia sp. 2_MG-2023]MDO6737542.1 hypothetical protein [Wenyingzhuangia sp. 2_MG-2023]